MSTSNPPTDPGHPSESARFESLLSGQQLLMLEQLPADHEFVGVLGRTPILRRPDGRLLRMGESPVEPTGVLASQGYLQVNG